MAAKPTGSVQILAQFWEDLDGNVWQNHGGVNGFEKVYMASQVDEIAALKASIGYVDQQITDTIEYVNQGDEINASNIILETDRAIGAEQVLQQNIDLIPISAINAELGVAPPPNAILANVSVEGVYSDYNGITVTSSDFISNIVQFRKIGSDWYKILTPISVPLSQKLLSNSTNKAETGKSISEYLGGVLLPYFDVNSMPVVLGTSSTSPAWTLESSTFSAHGARMNNVPPQGTWDYIKFKIRGWKSDELPTQARIIIREIGDSTGNIIFNQLLNIVVDADSNMIVNTGVLSYTTPLWFEFITNGKCGIYSQLTSDTSIPFAKYATNKSTSASLTGTEANRRIIWAEFFEYVDRASLNSSGIAKFTSELNIDYQPNVLLSTRAFLMEGLQYNIYIDNMLVDDVGKISSYTLDFTDTSISLVNRGIQYKRKYVYQPTAGEQFVLYADLYPKSGAAIRKRQDVFVANANSGSGITRKVLVIGDSTIANDNGRVTQTILNNFSTDVMSIQLVGTQGVSPNLHEGRGGWSYDEYYQQSAGNPFYNPSTLKFDISYYLTNTSQTLSSGDWIIFQLGINDVIHQQTETAITTRVSQMLTQIAYMITNIHSHNSAIKIGFVVTPPPANQDAFGVNYFALNSYNIYKRRSLLTWQKSLLSTYDNATSRTANIHVIPAHLNLDCEYNYPTITVPANSRNSTALTIQSNAVHPATSGYQQIADMHSGIIKYHG